MSESDSDDESLKSIRPGSAMSSFSDNSTGLQVSDCMLRRKAIKAMEKLEFELTNHMKSLLLSQAKGDKASIPKFEKKIKKNQEEQERKVSELRSLPPCLDANCPDHTFLSPTKLVPNSSKNKIQSQKRKNEKEDSKGFAFPKTTARPITPNIALEPLQTQNNFETLNQDPEPVINMTNENDPPKPRAPNPITLKVSKNYTEQIKMINETFPDIQIKTAGEYFKLFPNNVDQSRSLTKFLESDKQYQFYTIPLIENKPLKTVIKGLPRVTLPEEITIDLEKLGFTGRFENGKLRVFPTSAEEHRIIQKFVSDKKMRSHTFEMAHNKQLKVVLRGLPTDYNQELIVSVEPLNKSILPPQCYRCQEFFHHSRFCTRAPKCLKCSGGHLTSECTKSAKAPAKCANCSGPHPANFSGCPKKPHQHQNNKVKSDEKRLARACGCAQAKFKQSKHSFAAEVVKGSKNNSLDAKEVMTKMAQMMSQWGDMLSLLQSKL
ncbi:nucleic-acid-binding protein from transposon X-element [Trichonephila clavipes]|nr:nucleic-acid-binding protein from transposon X-element [Trichonephila clavipes]